MNKYFIIFIFATNSTLAGIFNPVTTLDSRSIAKNSFSFSRSPLQNINSTFLSTSLNFGLLERLEIGTVPIFYSTKEHRYNYIFKYNFYRSSNIDWSLAYGENIYKIDLGNEKTNLRMMATQLALNLHFPDQLWALGSSINRSCGYIDSKNAFIFATSYSCAAEIGFDLQYKIFEDKWLTLGMGRMRTLGFSPFEPIETGYGIAYSQFFNGKFLSRPSLGIYTRASKNITILMTTTFYETISP